MPKTLLIASKFRPSPLPHTPIWERPPQDIGIRNKLALKFRTLPLSHRPLGPTSYRDYTKDGYCVMQGRVLVCLTHTLLKAGITCQNHPCMIRDRSFGYYNRRGGEIILGGTSVFCRSAQKQTIFLFCFYSPMETQNKTFFWEGLLQSFQWEGYYSARTPPPPHILMKWLFPKPPYTVIQKKTHRKVSRPAFYLQRYDCVFRFLLFIKFIMVC